MKSFPAVLAALILSTAPLFGASQSMPTAEPEVKSEHLSRSQIEAFKQSKVTLPDAIAVVEKRTNGKAIDVLFENANGKPVYKVKTYQDHSVWEGTVDIRSAQIVGEGTTTGENVLDQEDLAELAALQYATVTLTDAVHVAEKHMNGKAIQAGIEETRGKVAYEIMVVNNRSTKKVTVDLKTGDVAPAQ